MSDHLESETEPDTPYEGDVSPVDMANVDESDGFPVERADIPDEPEPAVAAPETGDPRVDEVLRGLGALEALPTADHVGVYDEVHRGLQDALANLDQG